MSGSTVARLVRLDRLGDDLLRMVDDKRIPVRGALHLSDLDDRAQAVVARAMASDPGLHVGQHAAAMIRRAALEDPGSFDERKVVDLCRPVRVRARSLKISTGWIPEYVPAASMDEWVRRACELLADMEANGSGAEGSEVSDGQD